MEQDINKLATSVHSSLDTGGQYENPDQIIDLLIQKEEASIDKHYAADFLYGAGHPAFRRSDANDIYRDEILKNVPSAEAIQLVLWKYRDNALNEQDNSKERRYLAEVLNRYIFQQLEPELTEYNNHFKPADAPFWVSLESTNYEMLNYINSTSSDPLSTNDKYNRLVTQFTTANLKDAPLTPETDIKISDLINFVENEKSKWTFGLIVKTAEILSENLGINTYNEYFEIATGENLEDMNILLEAFRTKIPEDQQSIPYFEAFKNATIVPSSPEDKMAEVDYNNLINHAGVNLDDWHNLVSVIHGSNWARYCLTHGGMQFGEDFMQTHIAAKKDYSTEISPTIELVEKLINSTKDTPYLFITLPKNVTSSQSVRGNLHETGHAVIRSIQLKNNLQTFDSYALTDLAPILFESNHPNKAYIQSINAFNTKRYVSTTSHQMDVFDAAFRIMNNKNSWEITDEKGKISYSKLLDSERFKRKTDNLKINYRHKLGSATGTSVLEGRYITDGLGNVTVPGGYLNYAIGYMFASYINSWRRVELPEVINRIAHAKNTSELMYTLHTDALIIAETAAKKVYSLD